MQYWAVVWGEFYSSATATEWNSTTAASTARGRRQIPVAWFGFLETTSLDSSRQKPRIVPKTCHLLGTANQKGISLKKTGVCIVLRNTFDRRWFKGWPIKILGNIFRFVVLDESDLVRLLNELLRNEIVVMEEESERMYFRMVCRIKCFYSIHCNTKI